MAKVSVIIPTYNRADFLHVAITSVLNQTFQDFEIIVVDDASKDRTSEVVNSFHDKRIKYFRHETNRGGSAGGSAARNTGIINSNCAYIAFLDDDDEWLPEKLGMQIEVLAASPPEVGVVYTGYTVVDRASGTILAQKNPTKRGDLSTDLLKENCLGNSSSIFLRKECFEKIGLFDEMIPGFEDYDVWIRLSRAFHFDYVEQPLVKYYVHSNQIWTNVDAISQGVDMMLKKYGESPAFRKKMSYYYLSVGVSYCLDGNVKKGQKTCLKAIRLYPFEFRHYFYYCLSLLGLESFKKLKKMKDNIITPLRCIWH